MKTSVFEDCFGKPTSPRDAALVEREMGNRAKAVAQVEAEIASIERALKREKDALKRASSEGNIASLEEEWFDLVEVRSSYFKRRASIWEGCRKSRTCRSAFSVRLNL